MPMPADELYSLAITASLIGLGLWLVYRVVMYGLMSATVGQLALGLKVVKADQPVESKLTWGQAAVRGVASALLWWVLSGINGIVAAFTRDKQTIADLIAKTHVVKIR